MKDEFRKHLDACKREHQRRVANGEWPWSESQNSGDLVESKNGYRPLPEETIRAMERLGLALKAVYLRLRKDGYRLKDGQLIKPDK